MHYAVAEQLGVLIKCTGHSSELKLIVLSGFTHPPQQLLIAQLSSTSAHKRLCVSYFKESGGSFISNHQISEHFSDQLPLISLKNVTVQHFHIKETIYNIFIYINIFI